MTMFKARMPNTPQGLSWSEFLGALRWIDKTPLIDHVDAYRRDVFHRFFEERDEVGRPRYNIALCGRGKKNWKTADAVLAALAAVCEDWASGSQVYLVANDKDQARDDLVLAEKIVRANPILMERLKIKKNIIERKDGRGFVEVLPAQDALGAHGKTFRLVVFDEIHGLRDWDLLEALAFDPTRAEAQWWITSYASLYHRGGAPLHDLCKIGRAGSDPRMLFSWYSADYTTDPDFADATPEDRANPSRVSWDNPTYLDEQRRRLPSHKYRRLHLNLPGLPEGSAYQVESIEDAMERAVTVRAFERGISYSAFVDMSGGSSDDACLAICHRDADNRVVLDRVLNQGAPAPFNPRKAVTRFAKALREYKIASVVGDNYAGETFKCDFEDAGIAYAVSEQSKSELYEAFEPVLNAHGVVLLDEAILEQQMLGLIWRAGRIDHPSGEHDDWANAAVGALVHAAGEVVYAPISETLHLGVVDSAVERGAYGRSVGSVSTPSFDDHSTRGSGLAWGVSGGSKYSGRW
jgi:hypothetical protein